MHVPNGDRASPGPSTVAASGSGSKRVATPSAPIASFVGDARGLQQPLQWDQLIASQVPSGNRQSPTDGDLDGEEDPYGFGDASLVAEETEHLDDEDWDREVEETVRRKGRTDHWKGVASSTGTAASQKSNSTRRRRSSVPKRRTVAPRSPRAKQAFSTTRSGTNTPPIHYNPSPLQTPYTIKEEPESMRMPQLRLEESATQPTQFQNVVVLEELPHHLGSSLKATVLYVCSVLKPALQMLRYPLALVFVLSVLALTLNGLSGLFKSAFAPLCYVPGVNMMQFCHWIHHDGPAEVGFPVAENGKKPRVQMADFPALVQLQSKTFDQLVDESLGSLSGSFGLDLKKTEMAVKDLITVVRLSDLNAKESLAENLDEFVQDAVVAGRRLSRLSAKFNGALDNIMAVNDHAFNRVRKAREDGELSFLDKVNDKMPWALPRKDVDTVVKETFNEALDMLEVQLERLVVETEAGHNDLNKLEEQLSTLYAIVERENITISGDRDDLLALLWTKLGGHRKELRSFARHLKLLKELKSYRTQALAQLVSAMRTLQIMKDEIEDIRERVAAPDLAGNTIPPEVHMKSIQLGLERLKESRLRARQIQEDATKKVLGLEYDTAGRVEVIDSSVKR